jgi:hypothetical protein
VAYKIAADFVVLLHFLWIVFLIVGAFIGRRYKWAKILHITGMGLAMFLQLAGWYCPLTYLEISLRRMHDPSQAYTGSFIINYLQKIVYLQVPAKAILIATIFLVLMSAWIYLYKSKKTEQIREE